MMGVRKACNIAINLQEKRHSIMATLQIPQDDEKED